MTRLIKYAFIGFALCTGFLLPSVAAWLLHFPVVNARNAVLVFLIGVAVSGFVLLIALVVAVTQLYKNIPDNDLR